MKSIIKLCFITMFMFSSSILHAANLTQGMVDKVINDMDSAASSLNVNAVAALLDDNVEIVMNIEMQGQKHVMKPAKQEYIAMLQQGWSAYKDYEYSRSDVSTQLKGNKAVVSATVKESMNVQGQQVSGESKEEVTIELVGNKALVTKVVGYTKM